MPKARTGNSSSNKVDPIDSFFLRNIFFCLVDQAKVLVFIDT